MAALAGVIALPLGTAAIHGAIAPEGAREAEAAARPDPALVPALQGPQESSSTDAQKSPATLDPHDLAREIAELGDFDGGSGFPSESCLTGVLCKLKKKLSWRGPGWTPEMCQKIARGVLASSRAHDLNPALLLAVMINESSLDDKAVGAHSRNGKAYAKDSGLMQIRCVVDDHDRCTNGYVKGRTWKSVMDPLTNIELGARELARWRDGGAVERVTVRKRDGSGRMVEAQKYVPCQHKTHAYWAHYNHGPLYIHKGFARHYPHRVAVLYHALAQVLKLDTRELENRRITIVDPGQRPRTPDRPVEPRYRQLCAMIQETSGSCESRVALRTTSAGRPN